MKLTYQIEADLKTLLAAAFLAGVAFKPVESMYSAHEAAKRYALTIENVLDSKEYDFCNGAH